MSEEILESKIKYIPYGLDDKCLKIEKDNLYYREDQNAIYVLLKKNYRKYDQIGD